MILFQCRVSMATFKRILSQDLSEHQLLDEGALSLSFTKLSSMQCNTLLDNFPLIPVAAKSLIASTLKKREHLFCFMILC